MNKIKVNQKHLYCYISWTIYVVYSSMMMIMSFAYDWDNWVRLVEILMMAAVSYLTFSKKISEKVQSYGIVSMAMLNVIIFSCVQRELYPSIIVICCLAILSSVYMNARLLVMLIILSVLMLIIHLVLMHSVSFATTEDIMKFGIRISSMFFSEIFLMIFVQRLYDTEEDLKASVEEARSAEQSKADFLANMSHEIRTPMNAIIGMCELILRDEINDDVRENCFNIQNAGRSLLAIINDILDFSKIESGKAELIEEEFNIGSTINDVIHMAVTRKGDKDIEIIARIDPDIPKGLIGDEVRIKQIMINLVTNAVKFTNTGCVILKVTQNRHDYGINLNVTVSDTGIGISDENLEKLFTSFQQVDTRKNRSVEGTGLGLAISKRLVAKMGGFINVTSNYGEGSRFKFVIPLKVSDYEPFIYVKDSSDRKVAVYVDMDKFNHPRISTDYTKLIYELGEGLHTDFSLFKTAEEMKQALETGEYTHCFTATKEYLEDEKYFRDIAKDVEVVVVQDRLAAAELPEKIKGVYKPFYALSVAAVLNNERYIFSVTDRRVAAIRFTAPDAKVLIVDDNLNNLKVAEGLMKPYNMRIITVTSGKEALEALKSMDYDLVFMDHMMPEMDGVEVTRIIRQTPDEYYRKLPVIALTANAINGVREMFLKEGFNDFIAKPMELSVLDRVIKTWLPAHLVQSLSYEDSEEEKEAVAEAVENDSFKAYVNSQKGLVYAGGRQDTYYENLRVHLRNAPACMEALQQHFEKEDWDNYVIEVHALKSSVLSIGAEKLSEDAKELEFSGKEGNYNLIREKHSSLMEAYTRMLQEMKKYLVENGQAEEVQVPEELASSNMREITMEELEACIERIKTACEDFDGDEIASAAKQLCQCSYKGTALQPYFIKVANLADEFEYEQALETAESIVLELKDV